MAKKDELLKNKNNETDVVSDDKDLEQKPVEELQEELSSIFNEDYDETEEDEEWEETPEKAPLFPFLSRKERYGKDFESDEEKKSKKKRFPWSKKSQETEETSIEKEEKPEDTETPVEEKEETVEDTETPAEERAEETVVEEIVEEKEETNPAKEDEETIVDETTDETAETEEQEVTVEEIVEEAEEVIEELPPFEEEKKEKIEEPLLFEDDEEEIVEDISPVEISSPSVIAKPEKPVETVSVTEEKTAVKPVKAKKEVEKTEEEILQNEPQSLTKKDHFTFILALVALVLAIAFVCVKFFMPMNNNGEEIPESTTETRAELSEIQVARQGTDIKFIQSDIENVYYSFSSENEVNYYEYVNNTMKPIQISGIVDVQVPMGKETIPVKINYVKMGDGVFGITIFRSEDNPGITIHNVITFKIVDLPEKHKADGKVLLLAVANSESASRRYNLWTDSFVVDLNSGAVTRFLTADKNTDSYSVAYSVLTNSACATDGDMIPFFTTREYDDGSGKKDLFVKNGENESLFATDVYSEYLYADKDVIAYLKMTETGFNVVKKENTKDEKIVFSLYGSFGADYLYHQEYILNKYSGNLYNAKTGEEIALAGYKMSNAEMMSVSPDGRYLVVLGTVNSVADYQVHIFDLKKNDYAKYEDLNFSQHYNLTFADNTKVMYVVVDPNQGYEHVILDISKAF